MENNILRLTESHSETLVSSIEGTITSISNLSKEIKDAEQGVENAISVAKKAKDDGVGIFKKKAAIETLQAVAITQSEALESSIKASKSLFVNQQKIAQSIKNLYVLCAGNLAATKTAINELMMRLENAATEELNEMAQQELEAAITHLKSQEDFMVKISHFEDILREHKSEIDNLNKKIDILNEQITEIKPNNTNQTQPTTPTKDINKKTFFDTIFYKIIIGIIALTALLLNFSN